MNDVSKEERFTAERKALLFLPQLSNTPAPAGASEPTRLPLPLLDLILGVGLQFLKETDTSVQCQAVMPIIL